MHQISSAQPVNDGFEVFQWPEFKALLALIAPDPNSWERDYTAYNGVEIKITLDDVILRFDGITRTSKVNGWVLYRTDEFKAFARKFGFVWELRTTEVTFSIREGEMPTVQHTYAASQPIDCDESADDPVIAEPRL